jgi:hypothetical protein
MSDSVMANIRQSVKIGAFDTMQPDIGIKVSPLFDTVLRKIIKCSLSCLHIQFLVAELLALKQKNKILILGREVQRMSYTS